MYVWYSYYGIKEFQHGVGEIIVTYIFLKSELHLHDDRGRCPPSSSPHHEGKLATDFTRRSSQLASAMVRIKGNSIIWDCEKGNLLLWVFLPKFDIITFPWAKRNVVLKDIYLLACLEIYKWIYNLCSLNYIVNV